MRRSKYFKKMIPDSIRPYLPNTSDQAAYTALKIFGFMIFLSTVVAVPRIAAMDAEDFLEPANPPLLNILHAVTSGSLTLAVLFKLYAVFSRRVKDSDLIARAVDYISKLTAKQKNSLKAAATQFRQEEVDPDNFGIQISRAVMTGLSEATK
jgi:hypothetical protein